MPYRKMTSSRRWIRSVPLAGVVLLLPFEAISAERPKTLAAALEELGKMDRVEGGAVGIAGKAGRFWELFEVIGKKGNRAAFLRLTGHKNPVCRAMGLLCLARSDEKGAVPILEGFLKDGGEFMYFPGGCVGWKATVGEFAWDVLGNANTLEMKRPRPLVSDKWQVRKAMLLLSRDTPPALARALRKAIEAYLQRHKGPKLFARLSKDFPKVPGRRIIEALVYVESEAAGDLLSEIAEKALRRRRPTAVMPNPRPEPEAGRPSAEGEGESRRRHRCYSIGGR